MPQPTLFQNIGTPRCPRCGEGKLFSSLLKITERCSGCQLALAKHDAGDGPVFFSIFIVGFIVMAVAAVVEVRYQPPMWLHAALWLPFTFALCIGLLRAFKTALITLEFRTGRFGD